MIRKEQDVYRLTCDVCGREARSIKTKDVVFGGEKGISKHIQNNGWGQITVADAEKHVCMVCVLGIIKSAGVVVVKETISVPSLPPIPTPEPDDDDDPDDDGDTGTGGGGGG